MKHLVLAAAVLAGATGMAHAADLSMHSSAPAAVVTTPPPASLSWAGPYWGAFVGGAWGNVDVHDVSGYNGSGGPGDFSYSPSGFNGGALAGWNWQRGSFVTGFEGEVGYLGLSGSAQYPPFVGVRTSADSVDSISTDFYGALTGRVGISAGNFLFYGKGGIAGVNANASYTDTDPTGTTLVSGTSANKFMVGWTLGAGVEGMLRNGWDWRVEYMYADFGNVSWTAKSAGATSYTFSNDLTSNTVKVMLTKKW